jgi:glycosyltransferase involved in cell wall biosynthesis
MADPLVSVIIPTYNRRRWIGECLDSVRAQTYPSVETLVIDDRSTDGTVGWLSSDPRYAFARIHVQPENGGASEARNTGVRMARGEVITFIDSDDLLEPRHLETAVEVLRRHPAVGLFCCDARTIGTDGEALNGGRTWHEINGEIKRYPVRSGLRSLGDLFLFSNCFPGFTLRREVFESIGYLDQSIFPLDDYDLALRVAGAGYGVYYHHEPLARYRDHGGNCSGAANGTRVGCMKLRCLDLALARNPELRSLGRALQRRLADVQLELAVSHLHAGDHVTAARSLVGAVACHPPHLVETLRLYGRRLRRRASKPA